MSLLLLPWHHAPTDKKKYVFGWVRGDNISQTFICLDTFNYEIDTSLLLLTYIPDVPRLHYMASPRNYGGKLICCTTFYVSILFLILTFYIFVCYAKPGNKIGECNSF